MTITTHTLVKNEDHWIWYALSAWEPYAQKLLVVDDASTDHTEKIIQSLSSSKIDLKSVDLKTPDDYTACRNSMLAKTKSDWFLILDGDEIWDQKTIERFLTFLHAQPKHVYGVGMHTRNLIGDIYHYLPEDAGKYQLLGKTGHLTIRAYRNLPGFRWQNPYPLETYVDPSGKSINFQPAHLTFFDGFYWHTTHLKRSSSKEKVVKGWRTHKLELGLKVKDKSTFPEVFFAKRPDFVPSPWTSMSSNDYLTAAMLTPIKRLRRKLLS